MPGHLDLFATVSCNCLPDTAGRMKRRQDPVAKCKRLVQVVLLDPVSYPGAIKAFAKEVCRNDLLNFGRLHFFFPDSRLALDLNTDKTLKVTALCSWILKVLSSICICQ